MKKSLHLGKIAGIDLYIHWTFGLLIVGLPAFYLFAGRTMSETLFGVGLVLTIFACVVLHELGHALVAKRYDVPTRDITLYPIGGIARLQRMPTEPMKEFWIAVAGPAVNVVIAGVLLAIVLSYGNLPPMNEVALDADSHFLAKLAGINVVLAGFNLLPAFPMDGGRVMRALLATRMNYLRATHIAARTGQAMAALFGLLGFLVFNPILMFVALFVYLGAQQEEHTTMIRTVIQGMPVREAMMTRYQALTSAMTLGEAADKLLEGSEHDFPVVEADRVVGLLTRSALMKALAGHGRDARVGDAMSTSCPVVEETAMLDEAFQRMQESSCPLAPVVRDGRLVGVLSLENVGELMMITTLTNGRTAELVGVS